MSGMKQRYHTIIKPEPNGWYVGWVEEIPGTITQARSLEECRENLRDSLKLMVETHRDEARIGLDPSCIQESIEIDVTDPRQLPGSAGHPGAPCFW
jgi:predicted RNase H-like HicB family nuclease